MSENNPNSWVSEVVICKGGLELSEDALTQGSVSLGSAKVLQNFECALEGGYRRINGYIKWDSATVPGDATTAVLGVKPAFGGVFAARRVAATPTTDIYFSSGSGWGSRINSANRGGNPTRVRMTYYSITKPIVIFTDGVNPAGKWDGTTWTTLNAAGAPANPKYAEMFLARLILSGYTSNTSAITISAPNDDTNYGGGAGAVEINIGDVVVGLKTFRSNLYIFCQNSIFKLVGSSSADFAIQPVTRSIGCISGDTIQEIGGDLIYLAPDGFRSVAGTANIGDVDLALQSRKIQPIIRDVIKSASISQFSSCPIRKKSQYRCWFYDTSINEDNTLGIIGKLGANESGTSYDWSTMAGIQPYCADSFYDSNTERAVFGHPTNGYVYILESGSSFDGRSINAIYKSPFITFKDASLRKVMQKATIYTQFEGTAQISLALKYDFENSGILQPQAVTLAQQGSVPVYGTAVYGTDTYGTVQFPIFKQNLVGSGFTTAFLYSSTGGASYRIDSYQIIFGVKGRR